MNKINLYCEGCNTTIEVNRTSEIPDWVISLRCNWCPSCEDSADEYWEEWYYPDREGGDLIEIPEPIPDNQLCLPFIFDEIEVNKPKKQPSLYNA